MTARMRSRQEPLPLHDAAAGDRWHGVRDGALYSVRSRMTKAKAMAGQAAEERALAHLRSQGLRLVARNFRCRLGEIDLVMLHGQSLVFVEVRSRKSSRYASAAESVDSRKQRKLARAAGHFLLRRPAFRHHPMRFDVVALDGPSPERYTIQWLRDAFRPGD